MINSCINASLTDETALTAARQVLLRFGSVVLLDPRAGAWEELADLPSQRLVNAAAELLRDEMRGRNMELGWGELPAADFDPADVFAALPTSREAMNAHYETIFGLLVSGSCPPYETEYIEAKLSFQRAHALADIGGFYAAFGWRPAADRPERVDHLALEFEFMAALCDLERRAAEAGDGVGRERADVCRAAQGRFLAEHLAWWLPAFGRLLSLTNPGGYYAAVGTFLRAMLPIQRALLGVAPHSGPVTPSPLERPEECEGCATLGSIQV
ncbi:MAG TPA: molecular chaperone TorD family protein [Pirellulales bacterium]|nr:molecular chaperone TorD family protein [Pirellulales bacterium]